MPTADLEPRPGGEDPEATALARLGFDELGPALARLTEEQRSVLLLRVVGDLPIADVATIIGKRTGAVKQLQRRAVEAMRRAIEDAEPPGRAVPDQTVRPAPTTLRGRVGPGPV
ncbi:MAG: hypothetical protein KY410_05225, partial [Proteobacteria bacterium]|nr:hypothetical protein [Pseudomonadota bacterium]